MRTKWIVGVVLVAVIVVLFVFLTRGGEEQSLGMSVGQESGAATLPVLSEPFMDLSGNEVQLGSFGGPLVVNSWAVWCPFCRKELEEFAQLQEELGNRATVVVINRAESVERQRPHIDAVGEDRLVFLQDPSDRFYKEIGGTGMPNTIFLDTNHELVTHRRSVINLEQMRELVKDIL